MNWLLVPVVLLLTALGGCAASSKPRSAESPHPADPVAAEAPVQPRSTTLAVTTSADAVAAVPTTAPSGPALYVCPMHPEVVSTKADDRCPKCQMKLKPKPATQPATATSPASPDHNHQHGGHQE